MYDREAAANRRDAAKQCTACSSVHSCQSREARCRMMQEAFMKRSLQQSVSQTAAMSHFSKLVQTKGTQASLNRARETANNVYSLYSSRAHEEFKRTGVPSALMAALASHFLSAPM